MTDSGEAFGDFFGPQMPAHLYLHVPFCASKCAYCDFASVAGAGSQEVFAVFSGMQAEVRRWGISSMPGVLETVYVGGGTPSLHAAPVALTLEHVARDLPLREHAEITVEANPDSLGDAALEALLEGGANRISLGVQAFDDRVLRLLGRIHDARGAREAAARVRASGCELAVDLICGVPGQSMASWVETLEEAVETGAHHISVYPLAIEDGTPLSAAISGGIVDEPDPDVAADMMLVAQERLARSGLERYEVANYATPGHESRHNNAYWTGRSYIGIGPGAHGMLDAETARAVGLHLPLPGEDTARVRYSSAADIEGWLTGATGEIELLSAAAAAREDVMLGLRLVKGVSSQQVADAALTPVLEGLGADGLIELVAGRWRTTARGWLLGNEVFGRVWTAE